MREGIRIILTYGETSQTLTSAPEGLSSLEYGMARSEKFHGFFPKYSGKLGFKLEGKTFIDNILDTDGRYSVIEIQYQIRNRVTLVYEDFITGILNLQYFSRERYYTYVDFEGTSLEMKLNNRMEMQVPYYRLESIDGTVLPGFDTDYINLKIQGVGLDRIVRAIHPHELFESILQQILDLDRPCLYAPIFARTDLDDITTESETYQNEGSFALKMITKATYLRGWNETKDSLTVSLSEAFDFYDKLIPLGLGFTTDYNGNEIIIIAEREYFYQNRNVIEIDSDKIKDIRKEFGKEFELSGLEIGDQKTVKKETNYGLSEYNVKTSYDTTQIMGGGKMDLTNKVRTSGVAINDIITNFWDGSGSTENEYDEDIFIIDSMLETGSGYTHVNLKDENYQIPPQGIEDDPQLWINLDLSPARVLIKNWGKWLNISLQDLEGVLKYNKAETLSWLVTLRDGDTGSISEREDILLTALDTPIMTGNILYLDYPFSPEEIKTIEADFYGQVSFWDNNEKKMNGGWVKEINTNPTTEGKSKCEIYEAITLAEAIGYELNEDGGYCLNEDGSFIILEEYA